MIGCGSSTSPIVIQSSTRGGRPRTSAYSMHVLISSPGLTLPQVPCGCGNPCRSDAHGEATSVGATDHKVRLEASASRDETVRAVLHGVNGLVREARARDRCPVSLQVTRCPSGVRESSKSTACYRRRDGPGMSDERSNRSQRSAVSRPGRALLGRAPAARPAGAGPGGRIGVR